MAAPSGKNLSVGMRHAQIFALNADGLPDAQDSSVYDLGYPELPGYAGVQLVGAKAFDVTLPETRKIAHTGDDRVLQVDQLPSLDGATAELRTARSDYDVYALLTDTNEITVGEAKIIGMATDKQGNEPQVGMLLFQQSLEADTGKRTWRSFIIPKALVFPRPGGMSDSPTEHAFSVQPQVVSKHLWGTAFAVLTEGYTTAQVLEMQTFNKPRIVSFKADGTEDEFLFETAYPAVDVDTVTVWVGGVVQTSGIVVATTGITFTSAPADDALIVVLYEYA